MTIPVYVDLPPGGKRIELKCRWYQGAPFDAKSIPGYRWDKENKVWTYPVTLDTCHMLRKVYGDRLQVGRGLSDWARNAIRLQNEMTALGTAHDAELSRVPNEFPFMATAMGNRTYQRAGAKFIATGRRVGVFDEVGLGKTITAIAGIIEAGEWTGDHLVIANKTALWSVWQDQINKWTEGKAEVFVCEGTALQRKKTIAEYEASSAESKWLVINPHMMMIKTAQWCKKCKKFEKDLEEAADIEHWTMAHKTESKTLIHKYPELQQIPWAAVIVDEAHKVLSTGVKSAAKDKLTQTARGLLAMNERKDCMRIALTGTPARGKELNLWGIMHWLWPTTYTSKWNWVDMYFEKSEDFMGHTVIGNLRPEMQDRFWKMLDLHVLRRTRREVRGDLPESESYTEWVTLDGKHKKQYEGFEADGEVAMDGGTLIGQGLLSELTRLKQMAFGVWEKNGGSLTPTDDSPKLRRLTDMLEERGVTAKDPFRAAPKHYKYIVVSQFTQVIDMMEHYFEGLGIETLKITGAVTGQNRTKAVNSFQEDPDGPRLLLMNVAAGGESITLDKYCDTMFILDETFTADDQLQVYGRIDNRSVSAEDAVPRRFIHITTRDTVDEGIAEANLNQMNLEHMLLDHRRGVETAKMFLRREKVAS